VLLRAVNASKYVCGRDSDPVHTGELTALPRPLAGFGKWGKRKEGREGEEREEVGPHFWLWPGPFNGAI